MYSRHCVGSGVEGGGEGVLAGAGVAAVFRQRKPKRSAAPRAATGVAAAAQSEPTRAGEATAKKEDRRSVMLISQPSRARSLAPRFQQEGCPRCKDTSRGGLLTKAMGARIFSSHLRCSLLVLLS